MKQQAVHRALPSSSRTERRYNHLSPAEFLADIEVAVTDRMTDPRTTSVTP